MASIVPMKTFEVKGFRTFRDLRIDRLGQVNLVVGKNNVGKSSLLEALQVYASGGNPDTLFNILESRHEDIVLHGDAYEVSVQERLKLISSLFYGRPEPMSFEEPITIGPINHDSQRVSISIAWFVEEQTSEGTIRRREITEAEFDTVLDAEPMFVVRVGDRRPAVLRITPSRPYRARERGSELFPWSYVGAHGLDMAEIAAAWDKITLRHSESLVVDTLRLIAPGTQSINLVARNDEYRGRRESRVPIVRIEGLNEPIPLLALGQGMQRVLGIALALVNVRDGVLLVDEIENGMHYSVLPDLWSTIFGTARNLNVQVFATTHSWECIEAFEHAAARDPAEGVLIRLDSKNNAISAITLEERELAIATRQDIEVR